MTDRAVFGEQCLTGDNVARGRSYVIVQSSDFGQFFFPGGCFQTTPVFENELIKIGIIQQRDTPNLLDGCRVRRNVASVDGIEPGRRG